MSGNGTIRRVLTAMLALTILVWAEAGLALVAGDRVMACHPMMAASADADMADSGAMPGCPSDPAQTPMLAQDHRPCCSVSNDTERPLAFLVNSERTTPHPLDAAAAIARNFVSGPAHYFGVYRSADAPRFVKPILELKTDLRI